MCTSVSCGQQAVIGWLFGSAVQDLLGMLTLDQDQDQELLIQSAHQSNQLP